MYVMLLTLLFMCAIGRSLTVDVATCSDGTRTGLTLTPHDNGVVGRYRADLCTTLVPNVTGWTLSLYYYRKAPKFSSSYFKPGPVHSIYKNEISVGSNCSQICLNTTLDLIFSGYYIIQNAFLDKESLRYPQFTYHRIDNNYTLEDFNLNYPIVDYENHDEENVTIVWHAGVPFENFDMFVCKLLNVTEDIEVDDSECLWLPRGACAKPTAAEVRCRAALRPACYRLHLDLHAAWTSGMLRAQARQNSETYCQNATAEVVVGVGRGAAWAWALGALAALCAGGAAARAALRSRDARALHKAVLREWLVHRNESSRAGGGAGAGAAAAARRHVLLLYAREGAAGARLPALLKQLLELQPGVQVLDVHSARAVCAAGGAPAGWLRAQLARRDLAVVLLQTPALAALFAPPPHAHGELKLAAPLLGHRVQYRAPQYGDQLLQYAVRLTSEAPHAAADYHKYYIATLSELPTEIFPQLVPYRRYVLPAAAALLAQDVGGAAGGAGGAAGGAGGDAAGGAGETERVLRELAAAARAFADRAADRPDYLLDELVLI